jgi:hypothetical protein
MKFLSFFDYITQGAAAGKEKEGSEGKFITSGSS